MPTIGIDFGTTFSCVGVFRKGKVEIIANEQGNQITYSYVAFMDANLLFGDQAKKQAEIEPRNSVFNVKRLIGRKYNDKYIENDFNHWPFEILNRDNQINIAVEHKGDKCFFTPEELTAMILSKMKTIAETYLGEKISDAVITVPANFNDSQRQATLDAGKIAGLNVLRLINEPMATAIAYGLEKKKESERNVLIYDLGGGTFDVCIMTIGKGVFHVRSTAGNTHLGGEDFDFKMVEYLSNEFLSKHKKNLNGDKIALRKLKSACEKAKCKLSSSDRAEIELKSLFDDIDFTTVITRNRFEEICADLFQMTIDPVIEALKISKIEKHEINDIILVGASTRIPKIQNMLREIFNGKQLNKSINPDEAIAYGATVMAAFMSNDKSDILKGLSFLDATPISIGIETSDGVMTHLIPKCSTIPIKHSQIFTTHSDNQTELHVQLYEGERVMTRDNTILGTVEISEIPPVPGGMPRIEVTFAIDDNGIVNITCQDLNTGRFNAIKIIIKKGHLTNEEIIRMAQDAERYKNDDEDQQKRTAAIYKLNSYIFTTKATIDGVLVRNNTLHANRQLIQDECNSALRWLDENQFMTVQDFQQRLVSLEKICTILMSSEVQKNYSSYG